MAQVGIRAAAKHVKVWQQEVHAILMRQEQLSKVMSLSKEQPEMQFDSTPLNLLSIALSVLGVGSDFHQPSGQAAL